MINKNNGQFTRGEKQNTYQIYFSNIFKLLETYIKLFKKKDGRNGRRRDQECGQNGRTPIFH